MTAIIKKISRYRLVSLISLASLAFVLGGAIWAYIAMAGAGTTPFILHFNDIDGITTVGGLENLVTMGVLGVLIVLMNFFIALELESRDKILGKMMVILTLVMAILIFFGFVAILNVN